MMISLPTNKEEMEEEENFSSILESIRDKLPSHLSSHHLPPSHHLTSSSMKMRSQDQNPSSFLLSSLHSLKTQNKV